MQSLFEWDFLGKHDDHAREILGHNIAEFAPGLEDTIFAEHLMEGTLRERGTIDKLIEKCAPEWPLEQVTVVRHVEHGRERDSPRVALGLAAGAVAHQHRGSAVELLGEFGVACATKDRAGECVGAEKTKLFGC